MLNKKQIIFFGILIILFIPISSAQEAKISVEHYGFGKTEREVYFIFRNTGEVPLTNITVFVDGNEYPTPHSEISPERGVVKVFDLNPGEHLIEVRTLEGAYDSVKINTPFIREIPELPEEEEKTKPFMENVKVLVIVFIVAMIIVIFLILLRKPSIGG